MRPFLPLLALVCLLSAVSAASEKPNIIFILTDDQGYGDIYGNPVLKTPNLDRLHGESVRFTDFHVSPTCAPTRSALLTGRHEFRNGVTHTIEERERLAPGAITLPQVLQRAGYQTGIFGKWHLGDEPAYQPGRRGFGEVFIHGAGGIGQSYAGSCGDAPGNTYFDPLILHNGTFEKTRGYCTDVFFTQALAWIGQVKDRGPFYCHLATNAPHAPLQVRPEDEARYAGQVPPATAKFFGMIANIDDNVGRLLAKLDELGLAKNTLVIFMNDNGGTGGVKVWNAGMRGAKVTPWLGGTRAASFWRWPGALMPGDRAQLTAHVDFFPTLAELAGAELEEKERAQNEGRSLVPLLRDPTAAWPDRTLFTHVGRWKHGQVAGAKYLNCSVRTPRWHLVNVHPKGEKTWQLFDVQADPGETHDLAAAQPEVVRGLDAAYDRWWDSVQPQLVNEDAIPPKENSFATLYREQLGALPTGRKTVVSIVGDAFHLNGAPTYAGREWRGQKAEGLLMNSRMVQGIFDDRNPATATRWAYPDTGKSDAERNTREFIAAMPEWKKHGLLAFTINLQGGSPEGYSKSQPWENSAFDADGTLRADYTARLARILDRADELGMVAIVGYFYFGQDERLRDEAAVVRATDEATKWLLDGGWRNVLVEVNNETNVAAYDHAILKPARVHELIERVKSAHRDGRRLLAGTSYGGGAIPGENVVRASDFLLLHGNGVKVPARIGEMVRQTQAVPGYTPKPILFNEDDHFDFDQPENNFTAAVAAGASWGYFDFRMKGEGPDEGYQSPPVNWGLSSERKRGFFRLLAEITGAK